MGGGQEVSVPVVSGHPFSADEVIVYVPAPNNVPHSEIVLRSGLHRYLAQSIRSAR